MLLRHAHAALHLAAAPPRPLLFAAVRPAPARRSGMLNTLKRALGIAGDAPCAGCDPAILAQCEAAEASGCGGTP